MDATNREKWKSIDGFANYEISSCGRVRNATTERILKTRPRKDGYVNIQLSKAGKIKTFLMHRLVALAFIENPLEKPDVDHIDRNKSNNIIDNLRWSTTSENLMNSSKRAFTSSIYKGVCFHGQTDRWRTQIRINGIAKTVGTFRTEKEAAECYNAFAASHFGVRANLNTITN